MTLRDSVWHEAILMIYKKDSFKISELPFEEGQYHTARRVLRSMEQKGYLMRTSPGSSIWRRGPLADALIAEQSWRDIDTIETPSGETVVAPWTRSEAQTLEYLELFLDKLFEEEEYDREDVEEVLEQASQ
ncbi:hypothetical protein [Halorubrum ezzemoulense]|uniref:hypothetical protein n=1 Tax=Halorubrum ezzemoulense TaxID=337243 RepID=UPI00232B15E1|nr:hypothetical protein [Halorubrum ezzemoulense]MDB2237039.1 hypothetical protein [Halorubrum ezzemoulense]